MTVYTKHIEQSGFCHCHQTRGLVLGRLGSEFSRVPLHHVFTRQLTMTFNTAFKLSLGTGRDRLQLVLARCS